MAKKLLIVGSTIILIVIFFQLFIRVFLPTIHRAAFDPISGCQGQLRGLGLAMNNYAEDNQGKLPLHPNWCDVFRDELLIAPTSFICPGAKNKSPSYALNENVIGLDTVPDDIVILFDSKPGWNQIGGPELLAPENHRGKGCNVLFGNFEVKFIEKEKFGRLKWRVKPIKEQE